jgi:hypothetical protein
MVDPDVIKSIISRCRDALFTARLGIRFLESNDQPTRNAGISNIIVFGRPVTNIMQNLRSKVIGFDIWHQPYVQSMKNDPVTNFFYKSRSEILKEGKVTPLASGITINGNPYELINRFPKPPRAKGFFIGDSAGRIGWIVETSEGEEEKFFVDMPSDLTGFSMDRTSHFVEAPPEFWKVPATTLCNKYLDYLEGLIDGAEKAFS